MANKTGKGGFGDNPQHRNRNGRPKTFDALRKLAQQIAGEQHPHVVNWTRIEGILRDWADSGDAVRQKAFVEIAYGKVADKTEHGGVIRYELEYVNDWRNEADSIASTAFRAKDDLAEPSALQVGERRQALAQDHDGAASGD